MVKKMPDLHSLRHTFATLLARAGVPLSKTQELLGHSDPKLTAAFYTHLRAEDLRDAVEQMPDLTTAVPDVAVVRPERVAVGGTNATIPPLGDPQSMAGVKENGPNRQMRKGLTGRADERIRTVDLRFTKPLLYH